MLNETFVKPMNQSGEKFSRQSRLLTAEDYRRVFSKPIKSSDGFFTVLAVKKHHEQARLGLAISKKNTRLAVDRNRLKRLIRESFRKNQSHLDGLDLVVMARQQTSQQENHKLFRSLQRHWIKLQKSCN